MKEKSEQNEFRYDKYIGVIIVSLIGILDLYRVLSCFMKK